MLSVSWKLTDLRNPSVCFEFPFREEVLHRRRRSPGPFRFRIPDCDCEPESALAGADNCRVVALEDRTMTLDRRNLPNPNLGYKINFEETMTYI